MCVMAKPVDVDLSGRVESLQSTASYITCLIDIAQKEMRALKNAVEKHGAAAAKLTEWDQVETILNLAYDQTDIVNTVSRDFEESRSAVSL